MDGQTQDFLAALASAQPKWRATTKAERASVAKEMLACFRKDEWSAGWLAKQAALLKIDPGGATGRSFVSSERFAFGSIVSGFLSTFIAAADPGASFPGAIQPPTKAASSARAPYTVHGPTPLPPAILGLAVEVWCGPEEEANGATRWKGEGGKQAADGTVTVTLSAGNQNFLGLVDALDRCLCFGEAVLIKHHPLRPWLHAPYASVLAPLIARGVVAQVLDTGVAAATALVADPRVGHVHLTGAERTAAAVRATLDAAGKEDVGVTAELGCSTPWLVVPGVYTQKELTHAARLIVVSKKTNGGCNCLAGQGVVLARDWAQKGEFEAALLSELALQPTAPAYYPGSHERCRGIREKYAALGRLVHQPIPAPKLQPGFPGNYTEDDEPALLRCGTYGVGDTDASEGSRWIGDAFAAEAFGPVLALAEVAASDPASFLPTAVELCNSSAVLGSLSCCVVAPATVQADAADNADLEEAVAALRFGTVAVNTWSIFGYGAAGQGGIWGGHPADGPDGARSGCGKVGNLYGLRNVVKQVIRGPPLSTKPPLDLSAPPPALVMDALHTANVSGSAAEAAARIAGLMAIRALQNLTRWIPGVAPAYYGGVVV